MKLIFSLFGIFCFVLAFGQTGRQHKPLYDLGGGNYHNKGWFVGAGATYILATPGQKDVLIHDEESAGPDTLLSGQYNSKGNFGLYIELGKFHFFEYHPIVDYVDYGIAYKSLKGSEELIGQELMGSTMQDIYQSGTFNDGFLGLFFNANHIHQISDKSFLQLGLGLNADYRILERSEYAGVSALSSYEVHTPLNIQGHAKVSFGYRAESGLFIVPSLETPIINAYPFENGKSTMGYFNSRYRPLILSVKFMFWKKRKPADCVGKPNGKRGEQLWGKDMRKKYKR